MSAPELLTIPDVAERLGMPVTRVHQLLRERQLIELRDGGSRRIPADFLVDDTVVRGLSGTITLLTDAGFTDAEIVDWLFADDDSLPGTPMAALRENRGTEVRRRAQAAGF